MRKLFLVLSLTFSFQYLSTGQCTGSLTVTVLGSDTNEALSATETHEDLSCNANSGAPDGSIDLVPAGGTEPYTFDWGDLAGDDNGEDREMLVAGSYSVTITDANMCTFELGPIVLEEPSEVMCTATSPTVGTGGTNILCSGGTGTIEVAASGGSGAGYTYSINGTDFQASSTFTDVLAGTYTVTTMDGNGCTSTCDVTLTEPTPFLAGSCDYVQDLCQLMEGEIKIEASGGVAPYSVSWSATPVAPNTTAGGLDQASPQDIATDGGSVLFTGAEGNNQYSFTVTDANNCTTP